MNSIQFLAAIQKFATPLFTTSEAAAYLSISEHSAGKYLKALEDQQIVARLKRGKWALTSGELDPLQIPDFLTAPKESYISLHSALFFHGVIEQIPSRIYAVTLDRSNVVKTLLGVISFHHCHPKFFAGFEYIKPYLKMASPEKALVDYFYFSPSKSRQFKTLPEIEIPKSFSWKKAHQYCQMIPSGRTRGLVFTRLTELS